MPSIDQWFAVYQGQQVALEGIKGGVDAIKTALADQVAAGAVGADLAILTGRLDALLARVNALAAVEQPDWPALLKGNTGALSAIGLAMPAALHEAAGEFGDATRAQTFDLDDRLTAIAAAIKTLGPKAPATGSPGMAALGSLLTLAPTLVGGPAGKGLAGVAAVGAVAAEAGVGAYFERAKLAIDMLFYGLAVLPLVVDPKSLDAVGKQIDGVLGGSIVSSAISGAGILGVVEKPMEILVTGALDQLTNVLTVPGAGSPSHAQEIAVAAILNARRFGFAAHALAAAAERFAPLKHLGLGAAAATLVDLAGFKPITDAASRSRIEGAITRPMHWASNIIYRPEIPSPGDLELFVRKRQLELPAYAALLAFYGYTEQDIDAYTHTVYRDFTIRDVALALEDVDVDRVWLAGRIRTIGYSDEDADQLTDGLMQRAQRGPRGRVQSAGATAAADGLLPIGDYEALLRGLGLRDEVISLEVQAARIREHADYQRQASATYRRQYVSDVIARGDYAVALAALGIESGRIDLELADADAQRAPKIQREEDAAIKEVMGQVRAQLLPKYRQLYTQGLVSDGEYQQILEQAGIAPGLAAQAVSLDTRLRQAVAVKTGDVEAGRALDRLLAERQRLVVTQYRRGLIDAGALRAGLVAAGLSAERADVLVATEQAFAVPPPRKAIEPPAAAASTIEQGFQRRTALEDYRKGRIDEGELYAALVDAGRTPAEAEAEVGLELAKLPSPKP